MKRIMAMKGSTSLGPGAGRGRKPALVRWTAGGKQGKRGLYENPAGVRGLDLKLSQIHAMEICAVITAFWATERLLFTKYGGKFVKYRLFVLYREISLGVTEKEEKRL